VSFDNGVFKLEVYGSGGITYTINRCLYEIDYPTFLNIEIDTMPDTMFFGSDRSGGNTFEGVIDELRILNCASTDTRVGESIASSDRTITTDYNASAAFEADLTTILLSHFDDTLDRSEKFLDAFSEGFVAAPSVNENFGTALQIIDNRSYEVDNASGTFNNDDGTIEFWVSPNVDSSEDPNRHYYIDMSSVFVEEIISVTRISVVATQRILEVDSVRLVSDVNNTGTNYFIGGSVSNVDGKTISLGTTLPKDNVLVKVTYTPLSRNGDRVSIFKDEDGFLNFYMKASGVEHIISMAIDWRRHTWHRVMVMWTTNNTDNLDRIRLFADGVERGTIKYGTGLLYGTGIVYGQAAVGLSRFVVDNIDLLDTFSKVIIGGDVLGTSGADARFDNIRFSEIERSSAISVIGGEWRDLTYLENTELVLPVIEDLFTTRLLDFDKEIIEVESVATLLNQERGIFRFVVEVIDSFDKVIGNQVLEDLLVELVETLKPSHCESIVIFKE